MDNFRDSYFNVTWDLTKKHLRGTFWGKQYDTGRGFAVTIVEGGQVVTPSTEVLRIKWEKPDNTTGYVNATVVNGKFVIENIDQMFTVHGSVRADFELSVGGEFVASITFYVSVEKAVAVGAIESSSEFTALQEALGGVSSLEQRLDEAVSSLTVDGEVITARDGFPSLNARLDAKDTEIDTKEEKGKFSSRILKYVHSLHETSEMYMTDKLDMPSSVVDNSLIEMTIRNSAQTSNEINLNGYRSRGKNIFNKATVTKGKYASHTTGQILDEPTQTMSDLIVVSPDSDYTFGSSDGLKYPRMAYYDLNDVFISGIVGGLLENYISSKSPLNAAKLRISSGNAIGSVDSWQVEKGIGFSGYSEFIDENYILASPVRLLGYNGVSDTLTHEGSLTKRFNKINLVAALTWYSGESTTNCYRFYITSPADALKNIANSGIGKSSDGDFSVQATYADAKGISLYGNLFVTIPKLTIDPIVGATVLDKFKAYLTTYPISLYYQLTTPTTEIVSMQYPLAYSDGEFYLSADEGIGATIKLSIKKLIANPGDSTYLMLESAGTSHFGGYAYTSFGGGVAVDGKEIYVLRNAKQHVTLAGDYGKTVAYIRDKRGVWTNKIVNLGLTTKELRDVNLSLPYDGTRDIILSGATFTGTIYENWLFRLDKDLNLKSSEQIITTNPYFSWGNYLYSPLGVGMKAGYDTNLVAGSRGVRLLRKTGATYDDSVVLFPWSATLPTETTIGYWNNKLVAICRQNSGYSLYRETADLEGLTGWSEARTLPFMGHAPCLQPYTPASEPLVLTMSTQTPGVVIQTERKHRDISISATYDGVNWHKEVVMSENNHYGGYNSFVKIANGAYGMVYYDDYDNTEDNYETGTDLYYEKIDLYRFLNDLEWFKYMAEKN